MEPVPSEFSLRIADHNRSCWIAAFLSLLGAWVSWMLLWALYTGAVLLFETVRQGEPSLFNPPKWYWPGGAGLVAFLVIWGAISRFRKRFRPPTDRAIIGWHLLPEVLLLPANMTFSIWDNIEARIVLSRRERKAAWELLKTVFAMKRADTAWLGNEFGDAKSLSKLLTSLQLAGWIDLHRGEESWFYRVMSDQEPQLKELIGQEQETEESGN